MTFGLLCPNCGSIDSTVADSRPRERAVYRRRRCSACEQRFSTIEMVDQGDTLIDIGQLCRRDRQILAAVVRQMLGEAV